MAQFDASVLFKTAVDESSLRRAVTKIQQVSQLAAQIKPISLFDESGTSKEVLKRINADLDKIVEKAGVIAKGATGPGKLSGSFAGAAQQAAVISDVLANVNLQTRAGQAEVKTLAKAFGVAAEQAGEVEKRFNNFLNDARQARARELGTLTPEIQDALNPARRGASADDSAINESLNRQAAAVDDYFQERRNVEQQLTKLEERRARETFELEKRYTELETENKVKAINEQAARELQKGKETNAKLLSDFDRRLEAQQAKKRSRGRLKENLALGAGFPLLFGGGVGSVAGGIAGSFDTEGFGLQILLSAIGQAFDDTIRKAGEFGRALQDGVGITRTYEAALGKLDKQTKTFIDNLEKSGQLERARQAAFDQLEEDLGGVASAYRKAAEEADVFRQAQERIGRFFAVLATPQPSEFSPLTNGPVTAPTLQQAALTKAAERANKLAEDKLAIERLVTKEQVTREQGLSVNSSQRIADVEKELANSRAQLEIDKVRDDAADGLLTKKQEQAKIDAILEERSRKLLDIETQRLERNEDIARAIAKAVAQRAKEEAAINRRSVDALFASEQALSQSYQQQAQALLQITQFRQGNAKALALELQIIGGVEDAQRNILAIQNAKLTSQLAGLVPEEKINQIVQQRKDTLELVLKLRREEVERAAQLLELERQLAVPQAVGALEDRSRQAGQELEEGRIRARGGAGEKALDDARNILKIQERLAALNGKASLDDAIREANRLKELENLKKIEAQIQSIVDVVSTELNQAMTDALVGTIEAAIRGADDLAESLQNIASNLLGTIGRALISAGIGGIGTIGQAGSGSGLLGQIFNRENGGPVSANQPYIVGERGPEFFVPNTSGSITNNEQSKAAMSRYSASNDNTRAQQNSPIVANVNYNGPMLNFNGDEYIPRSEASSLVRAGAKQGEAMTLARLQNSRSSRAKLGL